MAFPSTNGASHAEFPGTQLLPPLRQPPEYTGLQGDKQHETPLLAQHLQQDTVILASIHFMSCTPHVCPSPPVSPYPTRNEHVCNNSFRTTFIKADPPPPGQCKSPSTRGRCALIPITKKCAQERAPVQAHSLAPSARCAHMRTVSSMQQQPSSDHIAHYSLQMQGSNAPLASHS